MDDGSGSVEESLKLILMQQQQGADKIIATPHFLANDESVDLFLERREASFKLLKPNLSDKAPQIILGAEVKYYEGISRLAQLKSLRIEGSNLLLLEMPFSKWSDYMVREITELSLMGDVNLVLAHIDRYLPLQSQNVWNYIFESDILTQVNASFFAGFATRRKALGMLKQGRIDFIGSDCHNLAQRPPQLDKAYGYIEKKLGIDFINQMNEYGESMLV
jgi:protein-tyrosine phosphatase